jgi:2-isopropylmalate synthase
VPYLAIDPADLGSSYEAVIRVNSQSGKGGVAWVLEQDQGLKLPRRLQIAFSRVVQEITDRTGKELTAADIRRAFRETYGLDGGGRFQLEGYRVQGADRPGGAHRFSGGILVDGTARSAAGDGNGPISAAVNALSRAGWADLDIVDYHEHALGTGADTQAAAYVECRLADGRTVFGVGVDADITTASIKAVLSAAGQS